MTILRTNRWLKGISSLVLGAMTLVLVSYGQAQDRGRNLIRSGYTRPGNPEDPLDKDGKILPVALNRFFKGKLIGGTVYFAVYERTGTESDFWGVGLENFHERFQHGKNFKNGFSPDLDTTAKYLYLYQVVNDRGLDPSEDKIKAAADFNPPTVDIASFALRLQVDPRYITSWGHFSNTSFAVTVPDMNLKGEIVPAVEGKKKSEIRLAVSGNPSVLARLPYLRYGMDSPAQPLRDLRNSFGVGNSILNLKESNIYKQLEAKKGVKDVVLAAWEQNLMQAAVAAREPEFVQILYAGLDGSIPPLTRVEGAIGGEGEAGQAVFRVDFREKNYVKLGHHSVVFGFTSDLPPTDEMIRIEDPENALRKEGVRAVVPAQGTASGIAPTPTPPISVTPVAGGGGAGFLGGMTSGGGVGGGGFPFLGGGAGGIGTARPSLGGGGAITGGGQGGGTAQGTTDQNQQPTQSGNQIINFNVSMTNQQSQSQSQFQFQSQSQSQKTQRDRDRKGHDGRGGHDGYGGHGGHGGHVVPEPGTLVMSLLGLPALVYFARRRLGFNPTT